MNFSNSIGFLEAHQPLPDKPDKALLGQLLEVLAFLKANPNSGCIPLLLGSIANWNDLMIYERIQAVLRQFSTQEMLPHLLKRFQGTHLYARIWCADTARFFPHPDLIDSLALLLEESTSSARLVAAAALENIGGPRVVKLAAEALHDEDAEDVVEILHCILERALNE